MIFGDAVSTDGLNLAPTRVMRFEEWAAAIEMVSELEMCAPFWLGDLLAYGAMQFGELYAQGIPERLQPGTLKQYQWTSERIPPENRREDLSWSHHRAVAALEPSEQAEMLDQAVTEGWGVRELTRRVKGQEEPTDEKPRVYKVELLDNGEAAQYDGEVFPYCHDGQGELVALLRAGKCVSIEC